MWRVRVGMVRIDRGPIWHLTMVRLACGPNWYGPIWREVRIGVVLIGFGPIDSMPLRLDSIAF